MKRPITNEAWSAAECAMAFIKYADYLESQLEKVEWERKRLEHYETTTLGLWATDRPDLVSDPQKVMFQLTQIKKDESRRNKR